MRTSLFAGMLFAAVFAGADEYGVMRPTKADLAAWQRQYELAPKAVFDRRFATRQGSRSVLTYLQYTPSERNQGSCGNCWLWAGTGALGVDLSSQAAVRDRLSVQWGNANCPTSIGGSACQGGTAGDVETLYTDIGIAVPWSNNNADWQDGDGGYHTTPSQITTEPNYPVASISAKAIPTHAGQSAAIANIKNVIDQDKAVWFGFYAPTGSSGDQFMSFWSSKSSTAVFDMDIYDGLTWDADGWGHAMLLVGYNDEDPDNQYYTILNSWGSSAARPAGTLRIKMDMDYDAVSYSGGASYYNVSFFTYDISWGALPGDGLTMAVSPSGGGETTPPEGTHASYASGDTVNISTTTNTGFVFDSWSGDGAVIADTSATSTTAVLTDDRAAVTANFTTTALPFDIGKLDIALDNKADGKDKISITKARYPSNGPKTAISSATVVIDGAAFSCDEVAGWKEKGTKISYKSSTKEPKLRMSIDTAKSLWSFKATKATVNEDIDYIDGLDVSLSVNGSPVGSFGKNYDDTEVKTKAKHKP